MQFDVVTLFPAMFSGPLSESILKKAIDRKLLQVNLHDLRDYTDDPHRSVDDVSYGGGPGMVIKPEPLFRAVKGILGDGEPASVVYLTPRGKPFNQKKARELSRKKRVVLVCGRYEELDQRFIDDVVDEEISIGDYVLTGGELGAMVLIDAVSRLIPGVIGDSQSHENDSFSAGLLDHSHYTRPEDYNGMRVPEVLLSGNHEKIRLWRLESSLAYTAKQRPDLLETIELDSEKKEILSKLTGKKEEKRPYYVALVHYPVYNKNKDTVATSITNLDIHDISRTCMTFGAEAYYMVNPLKSQIEIAGKIMDHWKHGNGAEYNLSRFEAFKRTFCADSIEVVEEKIENETGQKPFVIFTSAKRYDNTVSFSECRDETAKHSRPILVLFGTGWGMGEIVRQNADLVLEPILGVSGYNHLSVRSAVAIILDRLREKNVI